MGSRSANLAVGAGWASGPRPSPALAVLVHVRCWFPVSANAGTGRVHRSRFGLPPLAGPACRAHACQKSF
eukprot:1533455-Alexandrium_andersonii.AAC.1